MVISQNFQGVMGNDKLIHIYFRGATRTYPTFPRVKDKHLIHRGGVHIKWNGFVEHAKAARPHGLMGTIAQFVHFLVEET